jgi:hypothetical protein
MSTDNSKDQATRTETIKRALEQTTGLPSAALARGGRNLAEEASRFIEDAHSAAARQEPAQANPTK